MLLVCKDRGPFSARTSSGDHMVLVPIIGNCFLENREESNDELHPSFPFFGCLGKDALNFPFVLFEEILSGEKLSSRRKDQVLFSGDPSLPLAPAGLLLVCRPRAAATTHPLFHRPRGARSRGWGWRAAGYKDVPVLTKPNLDTWHLSQDPTFPDSSRILS